MALDRERGYIHNINRLIIAGLTFYATTMEGFKTSDALLGVSLILWLWLPECDRLEERLLDAWRERPAFFRRKGR